MDTISRPVTSETIRLKRHIVLLQSVGDEQLTDKHGSLYLPEQALDRQRYRQWQVVNAGPETPIELQPGMRVMVDGRFAGEEIHLDDGVFRLMFDYHIIAIFPFEEADDVV